MDNRQLDALVAQARGWKKLEIGDHPNLHSVAWTNDGGVSAVFVPPAFSTDMAEAMALAIEMKFHVGPFQDNSFYCSDEHDWNIATIMEIAPTIQEAICLAYLKAKNVEVPNE